MTRLQKRTITLGGSYSDAKVVKSVKRIPFGYLPDDSQSKYYDRYRRGTETYIVPKRGKIVKIDRK